MDMKRGGYPLRIFRNKLDNSTDPKTKVTMIEVEKFESPTLCRSKGFYPIH